MIPGMNLLSVALGVIAGSEVLWRESLGRTENDLGQWVTTYADPVQIDGSFQPVSIDNIQTLGLDLTRNYRVLYSYVPVKIAYAGVAPDRIEAEGKTWEAIRVPNDWFSADGWQGVVCVEVTNER